MLPHSPIYLSIFIFDYEPEGHQKGKSVLQVQWVEAKNKGYGFLEVWGLSYVLPPWILTSLEKKPNI